MIFKFLYELSTCILNADSYKGENTDANDNLKPKDEKKYPYPKGIPFIVSTEFCERFSYYGMKSKLLLTIGRGFV